MQRGRTMRRNSELIYALIIALLLIFVFSQYTGAEMLITDEYLTFLPYLLVCLVGVYGIKNTQGVLGVFSFALLGVGIALLEYELNTLASPIVTDHLSLTFTITHMQALTVVVSTLIGAVFKLD